MSTFARLAGALGETSEDWLEEALRLEEARFRTTTTGVPTMARVKSRVCLHDPTLVSGGPGDARSAAVASVGTALAERLEAVVRDSAEARRIAADIDVTDELKRRQEARDDAREKSIRQLTDQLDDLKGKLEHAEARCSGLEAELAARPSVVDSDEFVAPALDDFKARTLAFLTKLTAAVTKRLGFLPYDTRDDLRDLLAIFAVDDAGGAAREQLQSLQGFVLAEDSLPLPPPQETQQ